MNKKRSLIGESDPFGLEQLESRVLLSAVPFDLPADAHLPDDLPWPGPPDVVEVGPAAVAATDGVLQAAEQVPDIVTLPEASGPADRVDPMDVPEADPDVDTGPGSDGPGSDESGAPHANDGTPPKASRGDAPAAAEEVVRGPASIRAASGLAIAAEKVPDPVTLPEPIRPAADDASDRDPRTDVIPGPASVRAASGLSRAAENVPDHVTLPEATRESPHK